MKKKTIKICCCSCFLTGVIVTAGVLGFNQSKTAPVQQNTNNVIETVATVVPVPEPKALLDFEYNVESTWSDNGQVCSKVNFKITNTSNSVLDNWKVVLTVPEGTQIKQGWNGIYNVAGNEMAITPESYNSSINIGQAVEFGGIIAGNGNFECTVISLTADINGVTQQSGSVASPIQTPIPTPIPIIASSNPVGELSVSGTDIIDEAGNIVQLKGVSTHGLAWFPQYVNKEAFEYFKSSWNANVMRLAMYTAEYGGYCSGGDRNALKNLIDNGVNYANELGMYAIIDWHILSDSNPNIHKNDAISFFAEMASKYSNYNNVIYEICNEPNGGCSWETDIKPYAVDVINTIRQYDDDAIIIVGTPTWSQDVDLVAKSPIEGQSNIVYAVHFYAATHGDNIRNKVKTAVESGLPVFVSEFSICDASGNGQIDYNSAEKWMELINQYNLSYVGWNISNKNESSAFINASCTKTSGWSDDELSDTAKWLKGKMIERQ